MTEASELAVAEPDERIARPNNDKEVGEAKVRLIPWRVVVFVLGAIAGVIGTAASVASLIGVLFSWFPGWLPEGPPPELAVKISDVKLEERLLPSEGQDFIVVSFDAAFVGYKGDRIPIDWAAFDATGQVRVSLDPVPAVLPTDRGNWDGGFIEAEAKNDQANTPITFPTPNLAQCIIIRVYAYDEDFTRLDYADSAPFDSQDPNNASCPAVVSQDIATTGG